MLNTRFKKITAYIYRPVNSINFYHMTRIRFDEMKATIKQAFTLAGMPEDKAATCARIHTESSRDGVYSHGLNRVERFVEYIGKGWVDVNATCQRLIAAWAPWKFTMAIWGRVF